MKVLLVEDEEAISKPLCRILEKNNIHADAVYDGLSGYYQGSSDIYDVVILDIMLPEMNGLDVLRKLRGEGIKTPILLLTAKDSTEDKVKGLEYGADDYLTKPFETRELIARVKALARRNPNLSMDTTLEFGNVTLDTNNGKLAIDGEEEILTAKETHIMELLLSSPGSVISKEQLLDKVWGFDSEATDNTVEIYIHYLRKKIEKSNVRIVTQRGMGYTIRKI